MSEKCPKGYIVRKGYTRTFRKSIAQSGYTVRRKGKLFTVRPKKRTITVKASCIKDRGLPGKGPSEGEGFAPLRKGDLIKYGYQYRLSDTSRERALKKAIDTYGALSVFRKLDAVAKLSQRTATDASKIFSRDRNWIRSTYMVEK